MDITTTIINDIEYLILKETLVNGINYLLLVNMNNRNDFVIRKEIENQLIGLDNDEEFYKIINAFSNKGGE